MIMFLVLCCLDVQAKDISPSKVVIKVNNTEITYAQYKMAYDYHLNYNKQKYGSFPKEWEEALKNVVIEGLIREALISQESEKTIKVTDEEIKQKIKDSPEFKDSKGKFDEEKYRLALTNPNINWEIIFNRYRRQIAITKLENKIKDVKVTEEEIRKEFCEKNEKIKIKYVLIKFEKDKVSVGTITDSEIEDYYKSHIKEYQEEEQVRARHILIKPDNDKKAAKSKIEGILKEIKEGKNFEELAKKYSACPSKSQGGDLGFFGRGRMVKPFEDAAFSLKLGEISDIVETQFGFHIIKLEERKKARTIPLSEVKENIQNTIYHQRTKKEAEKITKSKVDEIYSKITHDFSATVKEYSLEVKDTGFFGHRQPIRELGYVPEIEKVFNLKQGEVTQPIKTGQGFIIGQLIERQVNETIYAKEKGAIKEEILKRKRESAFNDWYKTKKQKAKITINL